ncbi:hypothetical protein FRX31_011317, partial [Thalictrum thalictroides]
MGMRPTMASVVLMLNNSSVTMPLPSKPAFFVSTFMESYQRTGENEAHTNSSCQSVVQASSMSSATHMPVNDALITE